jgi:hypothetical protein
MVRHSLENVVLPWQVVETASSMYLDKPIPVTARVEGPSVVKDTQVLELTEDHLVLSLYRELLALR